MSKVYVGSSYYPPHHQPDDWARDLDRMHSTGLDTIRTGELLASWDRIEVDREVYDFSWLDRIFDLAEERDMQILLGTGTSCPPIWMLDRYPDLQVVSSEGTPYPTATTWSWACKNNPGFKVEAERWLRLLAERYGHRPALLGWQLDNEPGFPFVARQGSTMETFCYCHHTEAEFRHWLTKRYGSTEALSEAWRWDPTNHRYSMWSQVRAPRTRPSQWGVMTAWLDWRNFVAEDLAGHIAWQHRLLKQLTPDLPTSVNGFIWSRHDPFGILIGQDMWRLARAVDAVGYDYYPGIGKRHLKSPEYGGMFLDYASSSARWAGKTFWLSEIESGPINGWALGPDHYTTPSDIARINVDGLGSGAQLMLYQGYREWNCIPIHWGALVDLEGQPTSRLDTAAEFAHAFARHSELLTGAVPVQADIAILHAWDNAAAHEGMGSAAALLAAVEGVYRSFAGTGYTVEFVSFDELSELHAKLLVLPQTVLVSEAAGQAIADFVANGGHLVTFAKVAMLDDRGWYWNVRPGAGLSNVLGVRELEVETASGPVQISVPAHPDLPGWAGGELTGGWQWQSLATLDSKAQILGTHEWGAPAIVRHPFGAGAGWSIGTHLTGTDDFTSWSDFMAAIARAAGATPLLEAAHASDGLPRTFAHLRRLGQSGLASVTTTAPHPVEARLKVSCARATDLVSGAAQVASDGEVLVQLPARGSRLLILEGLHG